MRLTQGVYEIRFVSFDSFHFLKRDHVSIQIVKYTDRAFVILNTVSADAAVDIVSCN